MITNFAGTLTPFGTAILDFESDLDEPDFHVYRDGKLIAMTSQRQLVCRIDPGTSPIFRVFDEATAIYAGENDGRVKLVWNRDPAARRYFVEAYIDGDWIEQARREEQGFGAYEWTSGQLADETTHQFRVTAEAWNGQQTPVTAIAVPIERTPDPPDSGEVFYYAGGPPYLQITAL